jgi:ABC-type multidrug transport system fused ATPase/permease subunit
VPQRPYLFDGTVGTNIALGRAGASRDEIAAAAAVAALDVDLDTPVGDAGVGLSAGQARRVAIARAVLRDAPVLLLDEPTAGLDDGTERAVLERLRGTGRSVLAVTHRPAAIAAADRTVTLTVKAAVRGPAVGPEPAAAPAADLAGAGPMAGLKIPEPAGGPVAALKVAEPAVDR